MQVIMELEEYQHLKLIQKVHEERQLKTLRLQTWAGDIDYTFTAKPTVPTTTLSDQFHTHIQEFQPRES